MPVVHAAVARLDVLDGGRHSQRLSPGAAVKVTMNGRIQDFTEQHTEGLREKVAQR